MGGAHSRTKGHSFERNVAKLFREEGIFPEAERHLEMQMSQCSGYDLDNTGKLKIQCKAYKKYAPLSKIDEAASSCVDGEIPVLITKGDRLRPIVALYLDDFIKMLKDIGVVYN